MAFDTRKALLSIVVAGLAATIGGPAPADASEGGASLYLLGSAGPEAAIMPPLKGFYLEHVTYVYDGSASANRQFVVGGQLVAGLDATIVLDAASLLWVPSTDVAGGTLAVGALVGVGAPFVDVSAIITGPTGGTRSISRQDSTLVAIDPILTVALGWRLGDVHVQASGLVNVPIGNYRPGEIANVAFHRWVYDASVAFSWHPPEAGWDLSTKAGFTFNGTNHATDYKSGTDFHLEAAAERTFSQKFSAGLIGYYYRQVSGDSGAGAVLGPNKGEVTAVGATAAVHVKLGRSPAVIRGKLLREFDAKRRLEGTGGFLTLDLPLKLFMPAGEGR